MLHKRILTQLVALVVIFSLARGPSSAAVLMATPPGLATADSFVVLAHTEITNVPTSAITGDVGLSPAAGSNYTGLTAAEVTGTIYATSAGGPAGSVVDPGLLTIAKNDLEAANTALDGQPCTTTYPEAVHELGGATLPPGVYCADNFTLSGILTLDGAATDVWIFRSAYMLTVSGVTDVVLLTGGPPCQVWWQVGSSATLGTDTALAGSIIAYTSITLASRAALNGRALARTGAVTLDQNLITLPICPMAMPMITTEIHDANHVEVFSAPVGTVVHDMATISGTLGITPTGTVTFTVYHNLTCDGSGDFAGAIPLAASASGISVADPSYTAVLSSTGLSYLAHYGGDRNYDADDGPCEVLTVEPTAVELLYFQAIPLSGQQVQLQWATALEVDNFGFNLYRAATNDLHHASLIHFEPAATQGGGSGATYSYVDTPPYAGQWWYWLADVDTYGRETLHTTPINIALQPNALHYIYLPFVGKESLEANISGNGYRSR